MSNDTEFSREFGEEGAEEGVILINFKANYMEVVVSISTSSQFRVLKTISRAAAVKGSRLYTVGSGYLKHL